MGAGWKAQPNKSQVWDSRPKISPAASTKQYTDPGVQTRLETQAQQFNLFTTPNTCFPSLYPFTVVLITDCFMGTKVVIELHIFPVYVYTVNVGPDLLKVTKGLHVQT